MFTLLGPPGRFSADEGPKFKPSASWQIHLCIPTTATLPRLNFLLWLDFALRTLGKKQLRLWSQTAWILALPLPSLWDHSILPSTPVPQIFSSCTHKMGFPNGSEVKNLLVMQETRVQSLSQEDPLEKGMAIHSSILPGKSQGQKSLAGYSLWDCKESDMIEQLTLHTKASVTTWPKILCFPWVPVGWRMRKKKEPNILEYLRAISWNSEIWSQGENVSSG